MTKPLLFSPRARLSSFVYAARGLRFLLQTQHNSWVHLLASVAVVAAALLLGVDAVGWALLAVAIGGVWVTEALNTAVECICNLVHPEFHPLVANAKDVSAAAVLVASLGAVVIGGLVLAPRVTSVLFE